MNTTANGSSSWSCSSLINLEALKVGATVAYSLILVVSLVGNSLIVLIVYKTPTLRKPINMLIANMAMSDLLYPMFLYPVELAKSHVGSWLIGSTLGEALCKMHSFLAGVSMLVSVQSLVLLTVDRFRAVVLPLRLRLISRKLCLYLIIGTWILAVAFESPYLFAYKLVEDPEGMQCVRQWEEAFGEESSYPIYVVVVIILFFCIPFVLLVILYSIILMNLKEQVHPGEPSANTKQQRTRRNRKVLKMAIAIVVVFFICWIPVYTNVVIVYFVPEIRSSCSFNLYYIFTYFMSIANCAVNPIICLIFSSNYRKALKRLVNCCDAG